MSSTVTLNCPCCTKPCCPGLPTSQILHATITGAAGCDCATAVPSSCTLTYNGGTGKWEGTLVMGSCGHSMDIAFYYITGATDWTGGRLDVHWEDSCHIDNPAIPAATGSSCDPCSITFAVDVDVFCGCTIPGSELGVTVT